ncbi:unnamed protein product [Cylicocyclus nassatus]|uniref:Origin recognition complex subunit 4 n=1 Tax=Cylicocyclus nassatus TaxID=53992 RepID=A0AA36M665_CYLNA|nr:unnamed protein product [Cylicocyclus nassatus]
MRYKILTSCRIVGRHVNAFPEVWNISMRTDLHVQAQRLLENLDCVLVDTEEEKKLLEGVVSRFANSGEGAACVVVGETGSARTTSVRDAVLGFDLDAKLQLISLAHLGSDINALQLLVDATDMNKCVLIVEDADELASRQRQSLLYLLLDMTRRPSSGQWLVFLMVQHQNFIASLEKRVRSRLSTARLLFHPALTIGEYLGAFKTFLSFEQGVGCADWEDFVHMLFSHPKVIKELNYLYSVNNSYKMLKELTSVFLSLYLANNNCGVPAADIFAESVEMVMPSKHNLDGIIGSLSTWTLCALLCVYRRLRLCPQCATVGYRKILQDFRRLGNTVDSRVRVPSDLAVYKELDRLVDLGLLESDTKADNMVFRRCSLNLDGQTLCEMLQEIKFPSAIDYWLDTSAVD